MTIQSDVALYFARRIRAARAQVQADAEGYVAVAIAVEQLGAALGAGGGMAAAKEKIVKCLFPKGTDWTEGQKGSPSLDAAYERVRRARNIAVHEGAMSRAVAPHAIRLAIGLEVALMKAANTRATQDWMVPNPTVAHPWMTVAQVRSALLADGFSALPIWWKGRWHLVRDIDVVAYLKHAGNNQARSRALLQDVVGTGAVPELRLQADPLLIRPEKDVETLDAADWKSGEPALVVSEEAPERLLGVLTPHDLLTR